MVDFAKLRSIEERRKEFVEAFCSMDLELRWRALAEMMFAWQEERAKPAEKTEDTEPVIGKGKFFNRTRSWCVANAPDYVVWCYENAPGKMGFTREQYEEAQGVENKKPIETFVPPASTQSFDAMDDDIPF